MSANRFEFWWKLPFIFFIRLLWCKLQNIYFNNVGTYYTTCLYLRVNFGVNFLHPIKQWLHRLRQRNRGFSYRISVRAAVETIRVALKWENREMQKKISKHFNEIYVDFNLRVKSTIDWTIIVLYRVIHQAYMFKVFILTQHFSFNNEVI